MVGWMDVMYVRMYEMHVRMYIGMYLCMHACLYACMCVPVRMRVWIYAYMRV